MFLVVSLEGELRFKGRVALVYVALKNRYLFLLLAAAFFHCICSHTFVVCHRRHRLLLWWNDKICRFQCSFPLLVDLVVREGCHRWKRNLGILPGQFY